MTNKQTLEGGGFAALGVSEVLDRMLVNRGITAPTPIQQQSIPVALKAQDVIGIAQTGTGKTFAFGLPTIERLMLQKQEIGLIILPTRELALQAEESLRPFADGVGIRTAVLIGGASMNIQRKILQKKPRLIFATPGRLIDHIERFNYSLKNVGVLTLDEADRMLDMGFAPQISRILEAVPATRQTLLYSATMPDDIVRIAEEYMRMPVRVEVARAGTANANVAQELFFVHKEDKLALLDAVLDGVKTAIVFTRTKHGASKVNKALRGMGYQAEEIHSNRSLAQRKKALAAFKTGRVSVLVATDIAARGIDVKEISMVVNFDLPENPDDYVHRIGRTGRAGATGRALSFATPDQRRDVRDIERIMKKAIEIAEMPMGIKSPGVSKLSLDDENPRGRRRTGHRDRNFGKKSGVRGRGTFKPSSRKRNGRFSEGGEGRGARRGSSEGRDASDGFKKRGEGRSGRSFEGRGARGGFSRGGSSSRGESSRGSFARGGSPSRGRSGASRSGGSRSGGPRGRSAQGGRPQGRRGASRPGGAQRRRSA